MVSKTIRYKREEREKASCPSVCNYILLNDPGQKIIVEKTGGQNQQFQTKKNAVLSRSGKARTNTQLSGEWWHGLTGRQGSSMAGKKFSWHILPEIHT